VSLLNERLNLPLEPIAKIDINARARTLFASLSFL
jgi:hypothetical protein